MFKIRTYKVKVKMSRGVYILRSPWLSSSLKNNMFYLFTETLKCTHFFPFQYNHKHILTACQDRNVRVYMVGNGKHIKTFKGSVGEDGTLIKVVLDRSGV